MFRDYLLTHPETAQQYEQLKQEMAIKFKADRDAYTDSKTEFVELIIALAVVERVDCPVRPVAD